MTSLSTRRLFLACLVAATLSPAASRADEGVPAEPQPPKPAVTAQPAAEAAAAARPATTSQLKTYAIDPVHSNIGFSIRHLVSRTHGHFDEVKGTVTTAPGHVEKTKAEVIIPSATIDTGNDKRDGHLKTGDFFEAEKYPEMKFVLDQVTPAGENTVIAKGQLTIKGVTKPVELTVTDIAFSTGFGGKAVLGFEATTEIKREDYGITWNRALETGGMVLGEDVRITLNIEAWEVPKEEPKPAPAG